MVFIMSVRTEEEIEQARETRAIEDTYAFIFSKFSRSSICRSRSVMMAPEALKAAGSEIIVKLMCSKMFVSS